MEAQERPRQELNNLTQKKELLDLKMSGVLMTGSCSGRGIPGKKKTWAKVEMWK